MIDEIIKQLQPKIKGKLIYLSQYGSHLYGLNTENSDLDFRGVYIPALDDIILKKDKDEINEELEVEEECYEEVNKVINGFPLKGVVKVKKVKVDVKIFSLQKFIQLCSKADTNALDLLFSWRCGHVEQYITKTGSNIDCNDFSYVQMYRNKLINTHRLESPVKYAFKQATKYSIKGNYVRLLDCLIALSEQLIVQNVEEFTNCIHELLVTEADKLFVIRKGTKETGGSLKYLSVLGVEHQFNLSIQEFSERLKRKRAEYSRRSVEAKEQDGNDWKALSHAVRVLLEIQELLETGNIQFPLHHKDFLLDIKLGKVKREVIDEYFKEHLSGIMECMEQNTLNWKYDEEFWNEFIIKEIKNDKQL